MSTYVSIHDLAIGAILAQPILNSYDDVIIPSGTKIEEHHKSFLEKWGITKIVIEGDPEPEVNPAQLQIAKKQFAERSSWEPRNSIEEDMLNATVKFIALYLSPTRTAHESS